MFGFPRDLAVGRPWLSLIPSPSQLANLSLPIITLTVVVDDRVSVITGLFRVVIVTSAF
jgi:hypothetical protein